MADTARFDQLAALRVDLVCNERIVDLIEDGFDVALRLTRDLADSTLIARRLASSGLLLAASPAYLRQHGTPSTPDALRQHNCLAYTQAARPHDWTFADAAGTAHTVTVQGNLQANTSIALRAAALAGLGIVNAASFILHDDVQRGALVKLLPAYTQRPRELYALYPQNRHLSPKVRTFVDFAAEHYHQLRWE